MASNQNNGAKCERDATKPIILEARNVCKAYPTGKPGESKLVLNDISLVVSTGSFVTIVGPTGCGKSTFFRQILGAERPTKGKVVVFGKEVTRPDRNRGAVFQKYSLFPHRRVVDNIAFGLELEKLALLSPYLRPFHSRKLCKMYREKAMQYLEKFGLADSAQKYPDGLSGGMSQRVAIAQALIMNPKILCMDEPFGALDHATRESMQAFLLDLWCETEMTIFFVTHDLEEGLFMGTRIIVMSQYYTNDDGSPAEGAKIVYDASVPEISPRPTDAKYKSWFVNMLQEIRDQGLNPKHRQRVEEFNLTHRLAVKDNGNNHGELNGDK